MKFKEHILEKYLRDMSIDQLADDFSSNGWQIVRNERIGRFKTDLLVKQNSKTIVFEVKVGKDGRSNEDIQRLAGEIKKLGYEFRLVIPSAPKQRDIEIDQLDMLMLSEMVREPDENLDSLSYHTTIEDVIDIEIEILIFNSSSDLYIKGSAVVKVELMIDTVDGSTIDDSFPFTFEATLDVSGSKPFFKDFRTQIDTSSFYE